MTILEYGWLFKYRPIFINFPFFHRNWTKASQKLRLTTIWLTTNYRHMLKSLGAAPSLLRRPCPLFSADLVSHQDRHQCVSCVWVWILQPNLFSRELKWIIYLILSLERKTSDQMELEWTINGIKRLSTS